jgi:anthranilate phosphoribosyltransferase
VEEIKIDSKAYGIDYLKSTRPITLESSLQQTSEPSEAFMELARFNAAVILWLNGNTENIETGLSSLPS